MTDKASWRSTLVITITGLVLWLGAALVQAVLFRSALPMQWRYLIGSIPPVHADPRSLALFAVATAAFVAILLLMVRAVVRGEPYSSRGATFFGVWGATVLAAVVTQLVHMVGRIAVTGMPGRYLLEQLTGLFAPALATGLWLGGLLSIVAMIVGRFDRVHLPGAPPARHQQLPSEAYPQYGSGEHGQSPYRG